MPINRKEANLPIIYNYYLNSAEKKIHGPLLIPGMAFIGLDYMDLFGDLRTDTDSSGTEGEVVLTDEFENFLGSVDPALYLVKIKM